MEFGKVINWSEIDFGLPKQPIFNQFVLNDYHSTRSNGNLYVGSTAWSEPKWKGSLYPADAKSTNFLKYYSNQFNCVEANSTFYTQASPELLLKWKSQVPKNFKFCFKVPSWISRSTQLSLNTNQWETFYQSLTLIEQNVGILFLQLPEIFDPSKLKILENFLISNSCPFPLSIELRHKGWFKKDLYWLEIFNAFNITSVITDVAGRRDACHMGLSSKNSIIRFVANESDAKTQERIHEWGEVIKYWLENGANDIYFFIHQSDPLRMDFTRKLILKEWHEIGLFQESQDLVSHTMVKQTQLF